MKRDEWTDEQELQATEDLGVLRFITCGSVDDGKSTLIGRLLFDSKALLADTVAALDAQAQRRGLAAPDLALLTDGLLAEREQGITIDVAYRYFASTRRKFIIADCPGHEQYTRNMVTAASTADAAVLLVDARNGLQPQTRRHAALARLLGVQRLIVAVNKMDLVGFDEARFATIAAQFRSWYASFAEHDHTGCRARVDVVPICALGGDMVVERGDNLDWHAGPTLLQLLEDAPAAIDRTDQPLRLPVQWVCRTTDAPRGYTGRIDSGTLAVGDEIVALPSGVGSRVTEIAIGTTTLTRAVAGQSVRVSLADEIDISRGDLLARGDEPAPACVRTVTATLAWLSRTALAPARSYLLLHGTRCVKARVQRVDAALDIHRLQWSEVPEAVAPNAVVRVQLATQQLLPVDHYAASRSGGAFILVDEISNETVAAGLIESFAGS